MIQRIAAYRERYYRILPGRESLVRLIDEAEVPEHVYNSNAIENSTLTLEETEKILNQVALERYITESEIFEARNLARVVGYISGKASEKDMDIEMMLLLHKMMMSNINTEIAGRFRLPGEYVRVGTHIAPQPERVEELITRMLYNYKAVYDTTTIIKRLARLHLTFEHIHPFIDGNGRIGRVIINYQLVREGYVPINIKFVDRQKYYEAFREFDHEEKTALMEEILLKALTHSYHKRLAYLEGKEIITLGEYSKRMNLSHSNLLNKANRQTIEAFIEKGIWKIGI
ncbi:MAG: Fic family protein [Bacteroidales bacterium]|jgi:Fic family protein|nr:Fic family protein [Bacteroidales bacterium]